MTMPYYFTVRMFLSPSLLYFTEFVVFLDIDAVLYIKITNRQRMTR